MRKTPLLFPLAAALALTGCDWQDFGPTTREREEFQHSFDFKPGGRIAVENFNGAVEIHGWDQDKVEITGTKYASSRALLDEMRVDISPSDTFIQIRTVVPEIMGRRGNRGVKYRIHVPRRTRLDRIETSNGPVRAEQIEGEGRIKTSNGPVKLVRYAGNVDVKTSNGPVELDDYTGEAILGTSNGPITAHGVRGHLEASTSNGPITASLTAPDPTRPVKLSSSNGPVTLTLPSAPLPDVTVTSSNGPVTLRLPPNANAKLKARTSNSRVTCDFPLNAVTAQGKSEVEGNIGSGGPMLSLRTSNSSVRIVQN